MAPHMEYATPYFEIMVWLGIAAIFEFVIMAFLGLPALKLLIRLWRKIVKK